jgi:hypothetical protein
MPIPIRTMTPTAIQEVGTLRRYAPNASPAIKMRKPMRYVAKEDMGWLVLGARCQVPGN